MSRFERTPFHFRPMDELVEPVVIVEMALSQTGEVVNGWLWVNGRTREFWSVLPGRVTPKRITPMGWRHKPTQDVVDAWRASQAKEAA